MSLHTDRRVAGYLLQNIRIYIILLLQLYLISVYFYAADKTTAFLQKSSVFNRITFHFQPFRADICVLNMSISKFQYLDKATNILSGGPDPVNHDDGTESLGQLCIKRMTKQGNYVMMVK